MSQNKKTVEIYLDGFRKNDHAQILSCLTDDIEWTVFGHFHLTGKQVAELTGAATRDNGDVMRMSMAEVFVMRDAKIAERRAWVIELKEDEYQ